MESNKDGDIVVKDVSKIKGVVDIFEGDKDWDWSEARKSVDSNSSQKDRSKDGKVINN